MPYSTPLESGFVHLFTDGSYNRDQHRLGLGFVVTALGEIQEIVALSVYPEEKQKPTDQFRLSYTAEFLAAAEGLKHIPANCRVMLHTDLLDSGRVVSDYDTWVSTIFARLTSYQSPIAKFAIQNLFETTKRHRIVVAECVNDKSNDMRSQFMKIAHIASRIGSGIIEFDQNDLFEYEKAETPIEWPPRIDSGDSELDID